MLPRIFIPDKLHHILFLFSNYLLEYETLTEALQKWMPRFLALNYVFSLQVWYICLNLIDLSKKVHFVYPKLNLRQKKPVC